LSQIPQCFQTLAGIPQGPGALLSLVVAVAFRILSKVGIASSFGIVGLWGTVYSFVIYIAL